MSFVNEQPEIYAGKESFFEGEPPLPQSVGYAVVLGFGIAFSIFTTAIVYIEKCFSGDAAMTSEKFK
jgi:hypothetical protein